MIKRKVTLTKQQVFSKLATLGYGVVEGATDPLTGKPCRYATYNLVAAGGGSVHCDTIARLNRYADQVIETRNILGYTTADLEI
jgi:hypothetical protein